MRRSAKTDSRHVEVRLRNLALERQGRVILENVSWRIRPGERWVLAGGNGAGKTQLLKLIAGSVWPEAAARPPRRYLRGRHEWLTPQEVKEDIAYLGAERQDKYQRYGWDTSVERIVGTGIHRSDIPLETLTPSERRVVQRVLRSLSAAHL